MVKRGNGVSFLALNERTWRVSAKGYCTTWVSGRERCYTVRRNGTKYNVRDAVGQLISTWTP